MSDARVLEQSWERVRRLVETCPDDWGGEDLKGEDALQVFASVRAPRRVLVVTSDAARKRWNRSEWPADLIVVVAAGMMTRVQAGVIARLGSDRSRPIAFVGSADPMSLHAFLSLRCFLGARRVRFAGICDAVLSIVGDERARPELLSATELSAFDREHLRVVASLAKPDSVLGRRVAAVLENGKKISIAAMSFRAGMIPAFFRAALEVAAAPPGRGTVGPRSVSDRE